MARPPWLTLDEYDNDPSRFFLNAGFGAETLGVVQLPLALAAK